MFKQSLAIVLAGSLLSSCALRPQLRQVVIDHNKLLAQTEDELTLLNIVRAKERYPMHFTTITTLRGGATLSAGADLGFSLPENGGTKTFDQTGGLTGKEQTIGPRSVSPNLSGSISTDPSFDIAVLNSQKFQRGILEPVQTRFIEYLLQQGWADDLIMSLFFEKIDFIASKDQPGYKKGQVVYSIVNDNGRPERSKDTILSWRCFIFSHKIVPAWEDEKTTDLIRLSDLKANSSISDISVLDGESFDIGAGADDASSTYIKRMTAGQAAISFATRELTADQEKIHPQECGTDGGNKGHIEFDLEEFGIIYDFVRDQAPYVVHGKPGTVTKDGIDHEVNLVPTIRSVQGVMYFLGEYSRSPAGDRYLIPSKGEVFTLGKGDGDAAVQVRFGDDRYFIPKGSGTSLQVLDIVQQLLNLQKRSDELPSTRSVTVVR